MTRSGSTGTRSFLGNAAWMLAGEAVSKIASFVFVIIVARGLGPTDYGYFNFALSFFPLFLIVSTWGLNVAIIREIARQPARVSELFASGLIVRTTFGVGAFIVAVVLLPLLTNGDPPRVALVAVGAALLIDELSSFLGSVFKAFERMARHAVVLMVNRIGSTLLAAIVLMVGGDLQAVSLVYLAGSVLAFLTGWIALKWGLPPTRLRDASTPVIRDLFHRGTPLGIAAVFNTAVFRLDAVLLQVIRGATAVAMYGVAYRFFESFLFVGWSLANVALPRLSRHATREETSRTIQATLALDLSFYLPLAAGAPFVAHWLITALFSQRYAPAAAVVPWLTGAAALYAIAHLFRHGAIAIGRRRPVAVVAALALIVNVAGNLFAIPRFGFVGAGIVTFVTEVFEAVLLVGLFVRANGWPKLERVVLVPIVAGGLMAVALIVTGSNGPSAIVVGAVVYLVALATASRLIAPMGIRSALALARSGSSPVSVESVPDESSDL